MNERHRCNFSEKSRDTRAHASKQKLNIVLNARIIAVWECYGRRRRGKEKNTRESGGDTPAEIRADVYAQLYTFCLLKLVQINIRGPPRFMGTSKYTSHFISDYYDYDTRTTREIRPPSAESCFHAIDIRRIDFFPHRQRNRPKISYARRKGRIANALRIL